MDAHESSAEIFFRRAWWFAAGLMLASGLWQCYGRWAWQKVLAHV